MSNPNWVKGKSGNPAGKPKGAKNRETLLREERRAIFDAKVSQSWEETINKLPPTYIADQFLGKAPDKVEHSGEIKTGEAISEEVIALAREELKKRLANGTNPTGETGVSQ